MPGESVLIDVIREVTGKNLSATPDTGVYGHPEEEVLVGPLWDPDKEEIVMALLRQGDQLALLPRMYGEWEELPTHHG